MPDVDPPTSRSALDRARSALARTRVAVVLLLSRRDTVAVLAGTTLVYLLGYLYALGHLAPGLGGVGVTVVSDPLAALFRPALGPLSFTPVARVRLGPVTYLFSANTLVGLAVAGLVGLNLSLSYLAWRQPASCGLADRSAGALAGVPALLSGSACCGPVALIALGVQASGALLTAFQFLLPAAVVLLLAGVVLAGRRIDPAAV